MTRDTDDAANSGLWQGLPASKHRADRHVLHQLPEALRRVQVVARHPLGLRSLWDERIADGNAPAEETEEQLFTTWKIRTDGQAQRVIDYIWYVTDTINPRTHAT